MEYHHGKIIELGKLDVDAVTCAVISLIAEQIQVMQRTVGHQEIQK